MSHIKPVDVSSLNLEIEGVKVDTVFIPDGYIPNHFMPLVESHHIMTGDLLKNGMVVAIAESIGRDDPERLEPAYRERNPGWKGPSSYDREHVARTSRWAIVHNISFENGVVNFDGVYADGTIIPRKYGFGWKWAVIKEVQCNPADVRQAYEKTQDEFFENSAHLVQGHMQFNPNFINQFLGLVDLPESANEETNTPPANPNWKRLLRDAMTLKQVHNILKERDAHFAAKREQNEAAKNVMSESVVKNITYIRAGELRMNDVFDLAGRAHQIVGLDVNGSNEMIVRASRVTGAGSIITTIIVPKYLRFEIEARS